MCCLFGLIDTELRFTGKEKSKMLHALASASEARGTDATGVAYDSGRNLHIYKKPIPGHKLNFYVRDDSRFAMGHTRMTTQGSARKNYNNHPFRGIMQTGTFALAHNGVLDNDISLRKSLHLSRTRIETDSYIAVQLIVQKGILNFDSLRWMAEQLEGSYTVTLLGPKNELYFIKGDNPMCLYHYPSVGLYLYASTEEILNRVLRRLRLPFGKPMPVSIQSGGILKIDEDGHISYGEFDDSKLFSSWRWPGWYPYSSWRRFGEKTEEADPYLEEIKSVAAAFGYTPEDIDQLYQEGFTPEELEDALYGRELW